MRSAHKRVIFYSNAMPESFRKARGIVTDSPAATRKIVAISRALQRAGVRVTIVSMARTASSDGRRHPGGVTRIGGVPAIVGPVWNVPLASQLISAFWLACVAVRLVARTRGDVVRHLFYNQMSLYLPALFALTLRRAATAVDIEDGPLARSEVQYARFGTNAAVFFERLISHGALLATSKLAAGTAIRPVTECYGAVPRLPSADRTADRFGSAALTVVFAGYLSEETGLDQFADALALIGDSRDPALRALRFEVAGFGPGIERIGRLAETRAIPVEVHGRLDASQYQAMLDRAHIGLSLKPNGGVLSDSTFPSKTVELAQHGLALVTTDVSDVRAIFGDAGTYLTNNDGQSLVDALGTLARDRGRLAHKAAAGRATVSETLSYDVVGPRLRSFLFPEPA